MLDLARGRVEEWMAFVFQSEQDVVRAQEAHELASASLVEQEAMVSHWRSEHAAAQRAVHRAIAQERPPPPARPAAMAEFAEEAAETAELAEAAAATVGGAEGAAGGAGGDEAFEEAAEVASYSEAVAAGAALGLQAAAAAATSSGSVEEVRDILRRSLAMSDEDMRAALARIVEAQGPGSA